MVYKKDIQLSVCLLSAFIAIIVSLPLSNISHASDNGLLGLPVKTDENFQIVDRPGYCLGYCEKHEQAAWVCYEITKDEVTNNTVKRTDNFRPDPNIITGSAQLMDYKGSGYDRGHLAPAGDMAWSYLSMSESFYLSNISPQEPSFNRGIWKNLEDLVRKWAIQNEEVFVVTGPLLTENLPTIGVDKVSVPDFFYKIVLDYHDPERKGIAFLIPNKTPNEPLYIYVKTINDIELVTGLDFFPKIPEIEQENIESVSDCRLWSLDVQGESVSNQNNSQQTTEVKQENHEQNADNIYWITTSSGVRHNQSCRWYQNSKGRLGSKNEGNACKLCGG